MRRWRRLRWRPPLMSWAPRLPPTTLAALMLLAVCPPAGRAQQPSPTEAFVEVDFPETDTIPGQALELRLTVLVPTFMPEPVEFPSFERPNLRVRLPERGTAPTSRRIGAVSWAGVVRRYALSPMVPGRFEIPPQSLIVTYAPRGGGDPIRATLTTPALTLTGTVPPGAEDLEPFIAASALVLEQSVDVVTAAGDPGPASSDSSPVVDAATTGLPPGAAVRRTVTARIDGASPYVLPALLPAAGIDGMVAYPGRAAIEETDDAGSLGGTRTEQLTLMAEGGADGQVPDVVVRWFDLDIGTIETARAPGFPVSVDAPPATARDGIVRLGWTIAAIVGAAFSVVLTLRHAGPALRERAASRRARWRASERFARREALRAAGSRNYPALLAALDHWAEASQGSDPRRDPALQRALVRIGACRYGHRPIEAGREDWLAVERALQATRAVESRRDGRALPPLNPVAADAERR